MTTAALFRPYRKDTNVSTALQDPDADLDPDTEVEDGPDWVIAHRLIWGIPLGCEPSKDEIRLAVWHLIDRGYTRGEIITRTGLTKLVVQAVAETRRVARHPAPPQDRLAQRRVEAARAKHPRWFDLNMLGAV
jgi:hypothetical protein